MDGSSLSTPLPPPPPPPPPPPSTPESQNAACNGKKRNRPDWSIPTITSSLEIEDGGCPSTNTSLLVSSTPLSEQQRVVPSWMVQSQRESSAHSFHYKLQSEDDDNDTQSLANFNDWTPPDSSYGAAIPVAGWIPKRTRRNIERSLSICIVVLIVYVIVTASLRSERNKNGNSVYDSGRLDLDDDRYIAFDDAMYVRRDDDNDEENEMNNEDNNDDDDYFEDGEEEEDGNEDQEEEGHDEGDEENNDEGGGN